PRRARDRSRSCHVAIMAVWRSGRRAPRPARRNGSLTSEECSSHPRNTATPRGKPGRTTVVPDRPPGRRREMDPMVVAEVLGDGSALDAGNTAWMLVSASLVLLMTPGLAFFYGGMVRSKSVLNMMMMSFGAMAVIGVVYVLWGWSMSYGSSVGGLFGNPVEQFGLKGIFESTPDGYVYAMSEGLPVIVDVGFQVTFAIITVALISGAIADRVKFGTWLVFTGLWVTLSYFPMAHMVWGGGLLSGDGPFASIAEPIDFAGGTVVHINAGAAALVLALVVGKRKGFGSEPMRPHNLPFVMLGAALLWFGWFGFNAGSAYGATGDAGLAWVNTTTATA